MGPGGLLYRLVDSRPFLSAIHPVRRGTKPESRRVSFHLSASPGVFSPRWIATHKASFLAQFMGRQECGISSLSLYNYPEMGDEHGFCRTRASLLSAMSNGGRHGFDAAYTSQGKISKAILL